MGADTPTFAPIRFFYLSQMNVTEYRAEIAAYHSSLELARYRHRVGIESDFDTNEIHERYSDLFSSAIIADLKSSLAATAPEFETEVAGLHRLLSAAQLEYVERQATELARELDRCEASIRVEWGDQSLSINDIPKLLGRETKRERRDQLYTRWIDQVSACDDLRIECVKSFRQSAVALGFASCRELIVDGIGIDFDRLKLASQSFLEKTQSTYASRLSVVNAQNLSNVPLSELNFADYLYFQRMPWLDQVFPGTSLLATYSKTLEGIGIRLDRQPNVHVEFTSKQNNQAAECFRINPPEDVRLVASYADGLSGFAAFFEAGGKAQHNAWCSKDLAKRHPEFIYAPDSATTKAHGYLLSQLLLDPNWLIDFVPGIGEAGIAEIVSDIALLITSKVRRWCALLLYELKLHEAIESPAEQQSFYADSFESATFFRSSPKLYLFDSKDRMQSATRLRALAFAAGLTEYLRMRHGRRWWISRRAGDELIDLWNTASRYSVEELARLIGIGEIDFDLLAESLIEAMSGA
jgi:hypothetical protein